MIGLGLMLILDRGSLVKRNMCCSMELRGITGGKTERSWGPELQLNEMYSANILNELESNSP